MHSATIGAGPAREKISLDHEGEFVRWYAEVHFISMLTFLVVTRGQEPGTLAGSTTSRSSSWETWGQGLRPCPLALPQHRTISYQTMNMIPPGPVEDHATPYP